MNALIPVIVLALASASPAKKQAAPQQTEPPPPTTAAGRGPQLRVIKLDPQKAKAVYKVNAAPGLATVIQLPEAWTTTPTCGDCVFGDGKAETQLWRLDVFPDTRTLSIKPTRVPGADAPASAFVTNIDVTLDGGLAVTLFVELTLPEAADARVEFTIPDADYGDMLAGIEGAELLPQADRWTFVVFPKYELPDAFTPRIVKLLIKLPPLFPQAQPDMFYLSPAVHLTGGGLPQATSLTPLLGEQWQQFSWHLKPGAWRPGKSDFRDYMRCVRARLEKRN